MFYDNSDNALKIPHFVKRILLWQYFTIREYKILFVIIDETISQNIPSALISRHMFERLTLIDRPHVSHTITKLKVRNLILIKKIGRNNQYQLNLDEFKKLDELYREYYE